MSEALKLELIDDEEEEEEKPSFRVMNDETAEWAVRKIAQIRLETEKWKEHYERLFDAIATKNEASIDYFSGLLREYFESVPHHETKTSESYKLPSGTLMLKAQEPTYERDDDKLIGWLKTNGKGYIKTKETVDWAGLKKQLVYADGEAFDAETGELVDGIKVIEREPKFDVKIGG